MFGAPVTRDHAPARLVLRKARKMAQSDPLHGKKFVSRVDHLSRMQRGKPLQSNNTVGRMESVEEGQPSVFSGGRRRSSVFVQPGGFDPEKRRRSSVCVKPTSPGSEKRKGSMSLLDNAPLLKRSHRPLGFQVARPNCTEIPSTTKEAQFDLKDIKTIIDHIHALPKGVVDIDADAKDTSSPAYAEDIIGYLKAREAQFALPTGLLHQQTSVKHTSRAVLVDWLIQVQDHLEMEAETLHLSLALLDQMLALRPMSLIRVQLIGCACLLIASKVVERFPPKMSTLLRLTENAYGKDELKAAERLVMKQMQFDVVLPMPVTFLDRCIKASAHDVDKKKLREIHRMSAYLLELAFTDHRLMVRAPSERASAAIWLARRLLLPPSVKVWSPTLAHYSTYQEIQLMPLITRLAALVLNRKVSKFKGATTKYGSHRRYGGTSSHPVLCNDLLLREFARMTFHNTD